MGTFEVIILASTKPNLPTQSIRFAAKWVEMPVKGTQHGLPTRKTRDRHCPRIPVCLDSSFLFSFSTCRTAPSCQQRRFVVGALFRARLLVIRGAFGNAGDRFKGLSHSECVGWVFSVGAYKIRSGYFLKASWKCNKIKSRMINEWMMQFAAHTGAMILLVSSVPLVFLSFCMLTLNLFLDAKVLLMFEKHSSMLYCFDDLCWSLFFLREHPMPRTL